MDIGGTFTDIVVHDTITDEYVAAKADSTPGQLSDGVFAAIEQLEVPPGQIEYFVHGTTQGLNALLERRGASVMLITTAGLRDVYSIARGNRSRMFDLRYRKQRPLVARDDTFEVSERLTADGSELRPVVEEEVRQLARIAADRGYEAIAVTLLFSHLNSAHEELIGRILREELPETMVVLSHQVSREWREYERTSSTVLEAYTGPAVNDYLAEVSERFRERGIPAPVQIMQSSGGIVTADYARSHPLQTLLSGPVGGTAGGVAISALTGEPDLICVDMGGTSFDVSLVLDGAPDITTDGEADGFPVLMPLVNLHTIGAGGGSIAHEFGGGLRVGPASAGAVPGPACYGRGGTQPTVTDANLALGRVDPDWFAGGRMRLDADAATAAVGRLAKQLDLEPGRLAEGILDIANASMAQAIRTLTVEHGLEPSRFTLVAFGGAGPLHAEGIARELGVDRVVIPDFPGAFSAWGMLGADLRRDFSEQCFAHQDDLDVARTTRRLAALESEGRRALLSHGVPAEMHAFSHALDMRYEGQDFSLSIPLERPDELLDTDATQRIADRFHARHLQRYGHSNAGAAYEVVNVRVTAIGRNEYGHVLARPLLNDGPPPPPAERDVVFGGQTYRTSVYRREDIPVGETLHGPAIILEATTTTTVSPWASLRREPNGTLILEVSERA